MTKLLMLKDYILLFTAYSKGAFQEFKLLGDIIPNLVEARYGFLPLPYKKQSYRSAVSRLIKTGDIERKLGMDGSLYLEITHGGIKKIKSKFNVFFDKKWNGNFMIVIFDVPEKNKDVRESLRNKITQLGFGMLQKSVWISPYDFEENINEYLQEKGFSDYVYVLSARKILGRDLKKQAVFIWRLDDINSEYLKICSLLPKIINSQISYKEASWVWKKYLSTIVKDPMLPQELLPDNWARQKAYEILKKISALPKFKRSPQKK